MAKKAEKADKKDGPKAAASGSGPLDKVTTLVLLLFLASTAVAQVVAR